jgi:hypothetical protein
MRELTMDDDEILENELEVNRKLQQLGFMDYWHFAEYKNYAASGLFKYGEGFESALGCALLIADVNDAIKILRYWPQVCEQHSLLYKMYLAKEKALAKEKEAAQQ